MGKRVVDESSLQQLGDAIRAKTGGTAALEFPAGMADAISGITTGPDITILENQPFMLDFSAGDMHINLGETMAVRSGTIYKPADLLPENIRDGVQIAGITGTMAAGGGASEDVRYVTFMNGSEVLYVKPVAVGDDCADVVARELVATPAKENTAQYEYTYNGWSLTDGGDASDAALATVTEDRTVYAAFTHKVRSYTVTYYDADGTTVLHTETLEYGSMPSYTPVKTGYVLNGWEPAIGAVTGDVSYVAKWEEYFATGALGVVRWALNKDGLLTISGNGDSYNFSSAESNAPFKDVKDNVKKVVVEEGVTGIGNYTFHNLLYATEFSLPSTLTKIGTGAFRNCINAVTIVCNGSVSNISNEAFYECRQLKTLTFAGETPITKIGNSAFYNCLALKNFPDFSHVESIGEAAFAYCTFTSFTIPASCTRIAKKAFYKCTSLTSVIFEVTSGWWHTGYTNYTGGAEVYESLTSNTSYAAKYLSAEYVADYWYRVAES